LWESGCTAEADDWYLYSEAEMNAVDDAILGYEDAIVRKKPGAKEAYDAYIAKRRAEVDPINEVPSLTASDVLFDLLYHSLACCNLPTLGRRVKRMLCQGSEKKRAEDHQEVVSQLYSLSYANPTFRARSRFKRLGYHAEDISKATF
jgi:hypothetical protein